MIYIYINLKLIKVNLKIICNSNKIKMLRYKIRKFDINIW